MVLRVQNQQVNGQANYKRAAPIFHQEEHRINMLVVAMDYKATGRPLTCTTDARNIEELARQCGVQELVSMYDEQCTREAVLNAIQRMCSMCGPDDYFIFFYAGHGTNVQDVSGDEADNQDEAFVCVDRRGQVSADTLLVDDEFCKTVLESCQPETRILILTDCCHSGTIADLSRPEWEGRQAISIAGCQDFQCADDTGKGGIFTHAMLLAIDKLSKVGRDNYSVGMLFNGTLHEDELIFNSKQDITIQSVDGFSPDEMAWPLVPPVGYQAPLNRCSGPEGIRTDAAMLGISPAMLPHVTQSALNTPISIEEYLALLTGQALYQFKPCRGCAAGCSGGQCSVQ
mmetsp:Transcript_116152/g.259636  ORF Transcript_116152/g.259636 Transcript_116152/m.259636 type:complete len:343 (+) Transcript_116152:106-1134(+)